MDRLEQNGSSELGDKPNIPCCEHKDSSILAFKIYDKCKQKDCDSYGPSISEEPCECVILEHFDFPCEFGRFILPGRPIIVPEQVIKVKIVDGSFKIKTVGALVAQPSKVRSGYWDVEVQIKYEYKLRFYDLKMHPLKIKCLPEESGLADNCDKIKDYICASVCCVKNYTLFGGCEDSVVMATDFLCDKDSGNRPHALVELKSYPLDTTIVCVDESVCCEDVYDCIYEETLRYVYVTIGTYMMLFVYRIVSLLIESKGFSVPKDYEFPDWNACEEFKKTDFGGDTARF